MSPVVTLLIWLGVILLAAVAFHALDRWHERRAWRNAEREAAEYMRRRFGVERMPDGSWRDCK